MQLLLMLPFVLQALAIALDEGIFHYKRGLPRWERIGHPLDTLGTLACMLFVLFVPYSPLTLKIYIGLAVFSSLLITKDEFVHAKHCPGAEQWLHAALFILHPITLAAAGFIWIENLARLTHFLQVQAILMTLFLTYQIVFWNFLWKGTVK